MLNFYEFFAGGGMARLGLGDQWRAVFANDIDEKKAAIYRDNWGDEKLAVKDIADLKTDDLPAEAELAWASFPCQDLSLAGSRGGLNAKRSGAFWPFWSLMQGLEREGRAPKLIVLENVYGAVKSHDGQDFATIADAFVDLGYHLGAVLIDAIRFVPQSRLRLFIIGVRGDLDVPHEILQNAPDEQWYKKGLAQAYSKLSRKTMDSWVWWNIPTPPRRKTGLADLVEDEPTGVDWHDQATTSKLLNLMSDGNLTKIEEVKEYGKRMVGTLYRRTRSDGSGGRVQRAEVRFDGVAGCLRTPSGGSSRQTILVVEDNSVRSRLLSPREVARLMGLPDAYKLPEAYNAAYHLAGDGVVVPVVRHLAKYVLEPIISANTENSATKAA